MRDAIFEVALLKRDFYGIAVLQCFNLLSPLHLLMFPTVSTPSMWNVVITPAISIPTIETIKGKFTGPCNEFNGILYVDRLLTTASRYN